MIRIASIGYGDIAQRSHFPAIQKLSDQAQLVAIAGRNREAMAECRARFDIPAAYEDVDEMLARDDIDAVLVVTSPDVHADMAIRAVRAGKHVLLEKPMVRSLDEAHALVDAARQNPVVVHPLPQVAGAGHDYLAELLELGAVGQVTNVECHKGHRGPTHADWFYRKELAGGGVLFDLGIYALSSVAYVFGPALQLSALYATQFPQRTMDNGDVIHPDVEDSVLLNLRLKNGVSVNVNANWNGYLSHHHTRSRMLISGREGMVHYGVPDGGIYLHRADGEYDRFSTKPDLVDFDGYPCVRLTPPDGGPKGIIGQFLHRIGANDTSLTPLRQQVHVLEIMLAAYQCGGSGDGRSLTTSF